MLWTFINKLKIFKKPQPTPKVEVEKGLPFKDTASYVNSLNQLTDRQSYLLKLSSAFHSFVSTKEAVAVKMKYVYLTEFDCFKLIIFLAKDPAGNHFKSVVNYNERIAVKEAFDTLEEIINEFNHLGYSGIGDPILDLSSFFVNSYKKAAKTAESLGKHSDAQPTVVSFLEVIASTKHPEKNRIRCKTSVVSQDVNDLTVQLDIQLTNMSVRKKQKVT